MKEVSLLWSLGFNSRDIKPMRTSLAFSISLFVFSSKLTRLENASFYFNFLPSSFVNDIIDC